jgi:hypothetical protein
MQRTTFLMVRIKFHVFTSVQNPRPRLGVSPRAAIRRQRPYKASVAKSSTKATAPGPPPACGSAQRCVAPPSQDTTSPRPPPPGARRARCRHRQIIRRKHVGAVVLPRLVLPPLPPRRCRCPGVPYHAEAPGRFLLLPPRRVDAPAGDLARPGAGAEAARAMCLFRGLTQPTRCARDSCCHRATRFLSPATPRRGVPTDSGVTPFVQGLRRSMSPSTMRHRPVSRSGFLCPHFWMSCRTTCSGSTTT